MSQHEAPAADRSTQERIPVTVFASSSLASRTVAGEIAGIIRERAAQGKQAVLGLATGSTPQAVYDELVRLHTQEGLSFKNVVTFNLDEYYPMSPDSFQSYRRFMREYLFDHVDMNPANTNVPDGTIARADVGKFCEDYERRIKAAGGIDIQILGVGRTGHIGFNEPGSPKDSRTRLITLDRVTRMDAASDFFGEWNVPRTAITMGVGTILDAKRIVLMAYGEHKAGIIKRAVQGEVTTGVSASYLQQHRNCTFILDPASSAELTRFKTPWMLGTLASFGMTWDLRTTKKAVTWLALAVKKPILKLTDEDYNEHGLQELLATRGLHRGAYDINIEVFRALQTTITGWPGGRPPTGATTQAAPADAVRIEGPGAAVWRGVGAGPAAQAEGKAYRTQSDATEYPKRVVVFSPHPDDDVISMGGTFIRLCEHGHEVHVAYQTSGNIAVWDEAALRHTDFVAEYARAFPELGRAAAEALERKVESFITGKQPGQVDTPELQKIKGLIRRTEARAGARYSGVKPSNIHFLDLPFYETGRVKKKPLSDEDVRITMELLEQVKPHQIYAAGDLTDPHGTHRVCLAAITTAIHKLSDRPWMKDCTVWLYRGAWQEWGADEIEMAVPLSPDEVMRKRFAIFKHESQKDQALFPGPNDSREFWQRAEDRNRGTAEVFDRLGLPEYQAIEGFVRWRASMSDGSLELKPGAKV
ncbi:MAG: glucosamine-6-phosphate deaminase [Planctomycetota bacterium]